MNLSLSLCCDVSSLFGGKKKSFGLSNACQRLCTCPASVQHSLLPRTKINTMTVHMLLVTRGESEKCTTAVQTVAASLQQMISL